MKHKTGITPEERAVAVEKIVREEREQQRKEAQEQFQQRQKKAKKTDRINNAHLPAGSPMYFYCRHCGLLSDVLPESYIVGPKNICNACSRDKELLGLR